MKKLVVLFLGASLLVSCIWTNYLMSDDDLVWMSPYEYGDTILYRSADNVDSLVITEKNIYNDYEFIAHSIGPSESHGTAVIYGEMCHNGDSLDIFFLIQKTDDVTLRTNMWFSSRSYTKFWQDEVDHLDSRRVNGVVYNDLACIDSVDMKWSRRVRPYNIKSMLWSKSKGLIQYEYLPTDSTQGDVYTYYKKLPYKGPKDNGK